MAPSVSKFQWEISPLSQTVVPGESTTFTITITSKVNINAGVNFAAAEFPFLNPIPGTTFTFDPPRLPSTATSATLKVQTTAATPVRNFSLSVKATEDNGQANERNVFLNVTADGSSPTSPTGPGLTVSK
jgi:hypothetical protein